MATALIIVVGIVCAAGMVFAPRWSICSLPDSRQVPGKFELAVHMTRIMFPFLLLVALAAQAMGVLNACDRFGVPAIASTFFNLGSVGFGIVLGVCMGPLLHLDAHRRHGDRRGARRRAATDLATAQPASPGIPVPARAQVVRTPDCSASCG